MPLGHISQKVNVFEVFRFSGHECGLVRGEKLLFVMISGFNCPIRTVTDALNSAAELQKMSK